MTKEQMRIVVAEILGWKKDGDSDRFGNQLYERNGQFRVIPNLPNNYDSLPNYPEDLNACTEFEKTLTDEEWREYCWHLIQLGSDNYYTWKPEEYNTIKTWEFGFAVKTNAAHKTQAFLRVKRKWKDS